MDLKRQLRVTACIVGLLICGSLILGLSIWGLTWSHDQSESVTVLFVLTISTAFFGLGWYIIALTVVWLPVYCQRHACTTRGKRSPIGHADHKAQGQTSARGAGQEKTRQSGCTSPITGAIPGLRSVPCTFCFCQSEIASTDHEKTRQLSRLRARKIIRKRVERSSEMVSSATELVVSAKRVRPVGRHVE